MKISEVRNSVLSMPGATMVRTNKTNYIVIPCEDGIAKIEVKTALASDTKNHKAFNLEAAIAEYKAWEAETALRATERANKPVVENAHKAEAQARRDALDAKIADLPSFSDYTATDIMKHLEGLAENVTVMAIGSSAKRLVEKGVLSMEVRDKKSYYTKA